jgi:peptide/nickel transport system permease protein
LKIAYPTFLFRNRLTTAGFVLSVFVLAFLVYALTLDQARAVNSIDPAVRALPPSPTHLFGTDAYGRDLFSMIAIAIQTDLYIGLVAAAISSAIGICVGAASAILGGWRDQALMRFAEIFLSVPALIFALAIVAAFGKSFNFLILALSVFSWPYLARLVRSRALTELTKPYAEMMRVLGMKKARILFNHVLPNMGFFLGSLVAIQITLTIGLLAAMEYIGFSTGSLTPELGAIITQAQPFVFSDAWMTIFPSIFLVILILAFTLLSNGMRHLDPRAEHSHREHGWDGMVQIRQEEPAAGR